MDRTNFKGYRESLKSRCLQMFVFFNTAYVLDELYYIYSKNRLGKKNPRPIE